MPYEWLPPAPDCTFRLQLWPYRSLPRRGMVWFIGATALFTALPLLVMVGSPALWALLPFGMLATGAIWVALERSFRDGEILETLTLAAGHLTLTRHGPRRQRAEWRANCHWVRVHLHARGGPVPNYLTLQGGPREVELGAFLSEGERLSLLEDLRKALALLRGPAIL